MFTAIHEYGVKNAEGKFESVILGEFATKRAAFKAAREFVKVNADASVLITAGRSQSFDDEVGVIFVDDFGSVVTERYTNVA